MIERANKRLLNECLPQVKLDMGSVAAFLASILPEGENGAPFSEEVQEKWEALLLRNGFDVKAYGEAIKNIPKSAMM
jgi:hypothetical protein